MAETLFRTSQDRQREELARAQGLRPQSSGLGPFSSMLKTSEPEVNASYNIPGSYLPNTQPRTTQIGTNRDGSAMSVVNEVPQAASLMGIPELAAIPLAATTAYNTVTGAKNAFSGKDLTFAEQAALAFPTLGTSFLFNPIKDFFGSKKPKEQQQRDAFRDLLVQRGIASRPEGTDDALINLFGGGQYDVGVDGKNKLGNTDGTNRRPYEVDLSSPGIGETISALNPLGILLAHQSGMGDQQSNATGMLVNAVTAGGGDAGQIKNRILNIYQQAGYTPDEVIGGLTQLAQAGKISNDDLKVFTNSINSISSPGPTASLNIGGGMSAPRPKPQVDMSLMKGPVDPLAQTRQAYDQTQQRNEQRLQLFPKQGQNGYQPLGAFR